MAFNILQIKATPQFNTLNSNYTNALPKNKTNIIWAPGNNAQLEESTTGSNRCVTFQLTREPVSGQWAPVPILVSGIAPVIATWYVPPNQGPPATFKVQVKLDGRDWILSTDDIQVTSPTAVSIETKSMRVLQQVFDIPMRISGDWTWAIQRTDKTGFPEVLMADKTRLEVCFVFGALAPTGPWDPDALDPSQPTRPDFKDKYYIDLFRLFLPSQWELIDELGRGKSVDDQLAWYLRRNMKVIWSLGLSEQPSEFPKRRPTLLSTAGLMGPSSFYLVPVPGLATGEGAASFNSQFGGLFDLPRFMSNSFGYCTALDLAALVQLCVSLVRDGDGKELLDSHWVASTGNKSLGVHHWGYINPGTLFGWPGYPDCNSPVFSGGGLPSYLKPEAFSMRRPLDWHAWIEVQFPGSNTRTVLDASQAFGSPGNLQLVDGKLSREAYLNLKMDPSWPSPARLPPRTPARRNMDAVYFCKLFTPISHVLFVSTLDVLLHSHCPFGRRNFNTLKWLTRSSVH
ncbi:hypothetical protein PFICI_06272 [Pestalotiopsis fici W106-1]|uniref:Uncharacterized protein n=1 Tax=Pestalotiopsis fici (strain W106-1 / CGMCC3.15140) TaxID=1229662 RepID=W3X5E7_PESFW|nr:uncharacterized protein PFICI_06272 [Pestalotiopsis fici W106-1]ETS81270.1 hypothetical protein PFICI_06272 [Pestalotiopsis fici W106-1]